MKSKYTLFSLGIILSAFFYISSVVAGPLPPPPTPALDLQVKFDVRDNIIVGESFDVDILTILPGPVGGLAFGFNHDTDAGNFFSFDHYIIGTGLKDDASFNPNDIGGSALPFSLLSGEILLATLSFTADEVGSDMLLISGPYTNAFSGLYGSTPWPNPQPVNYNLIGELGITVNPIPEPATLLLFGSGLAGIGLLRRRKCKG